MTSFVPGQAIKYSGSVCWPDGEVMVTGDQLCLVTAQRVVYGDVRYDVRTPVAFIRDVTLRALDFEVIE